MTKTTTEPRLPCSLLDCPLTWDEWNLLELWPAWVPQKWRTLIEEFWGERMGRSPLQWLENTIAPYNHCCDFGSIQTGYYTFGHRGEPFTGLYVHTWNNMCILVADDGEVQVESTPLRRPAP